MKFRRVAENLAKCEPYGTYYMVWSEGNRCRRRSLDTTSRETANLRLRDELAKVRRLDLTKRHLTFGALADQWQTVVLAGRDLKPRARDDRMDNLRALFRHWAGLRELALRDLTRTDCDRWKAHRMRIISPQRFNNELGTLKQILNWAVEQGALAVNPAAGLARLRIPKTETVIPTRAEFDAIVRYLHDHDNSEAGWFVEFLAYSGCRLGEAAAVKWTDIDFERHQFHVTGGAASTKNRQSRWVPLFPALADLLARIPRMMNRPTILAYRQCRGSIETACRALSLTRFTHHDLRHFFVSNAIEQGIDFKTIAAWVGHLDGGLLVARTYGHLRPTHSQQMAAKMTWTANASSTSIVNPNPAKPATP